MRRKCVVNGDGHRDFLLRRGRLLCNAGVVCLRWIGGRGRLLGIGGRGRLLLVRGRARELRVERRRLVLVPDR